MLIRLKKILLALVFFVSLNSNAIAQKGTVATGIEAVGSGGSVSATIGQIDFMHQSGSNGNLNQGIQQPYELAVTLGASNESVNLIANVFPNPTTNTLNLSIQDYNLKTYSFSLYDAAGKMIFRGEVDNLLTEVDLRAFSNGVYILSVYSGNVLDKQFRIVKHQ